MNKQKYDKVVIIDLYNQGKTYKEIGQEMNCNPNYIANIISKLGLANHNKDRKKAIIAKRELSMDEVIKEISEESSKLSENLRKKKEIRDRAYYGTEDQKKKNYNKSSKKDKIEKQKTKSIIESNIDNEDYKPLYKSYNKYGNPTFKNLVVNGYFVIDPFNRIVVNEEDGKEYKVMTLNEIGEALMKVNK